MAGEKKSPFPATNNANIPPPDATAGSKNLETIESILRRPRGYIGSVKKKTQTLWVYENGRMIQRPVTYVPGLYKIFDEVLVNAAGNNSKMDSLKVDIDVESNSISFYSTGVRIHEEEEEEELILLTNIDYDDKMFRMNGCGAKLTNIFSTEFVVETADGKRQIKRKQVFSDNMRKKSEPIISECGENENWTKITFKPDLARFNMTSLNEDDVVALMKKRVIDIAGCAGKSVKVDFNGTTFQFESFSSYCQLYMNSAEPLPSFEEYVNDRWHICITRSNGHFQQVSFVNNIATIKGGSHVDYVSCKIAKHLASVINEKYMYMCAHVDPREVKNQLWVFVKALVDDPAFDSPTYETLRRRGGVYSFWWHFRPEFLDKVAESDVMKNIEEWAEPKLQRDFELRIMMKHGDPRPLMEEEEEKTNNYTLILTQGDIHPGICHPAFGRLYGMFPLSGEKLLNVREASDAQIRNNAELAQIMFVLGLQFGVKYDDEESLKSLNYRRVMIMTDQTPYGSYIKGLLISFFHRFWPALLKDPAFLHDFMTPIVKAERRDWKTTRTFYTMPQYVEWKERLGTEAKNWRIHYYEGLASFTLDEAEEYFLKLEHKRAFVWENDEDSEAIELAFSKEKIEARKNWIQNSVHRRGTFLDLISEEKKIKYRDFVNTELVYYFIEDHERSMPSIVDGLKPGQREILLSLFKRKSVDEITVLDLCGYVQRCSPYFREQRRLVNTIIGMARDFVGSNNINLLLPNGVFGSRCQGGKDHVPPEYNLSTQLSPMTRFLYPRWDDDIFLPFLNEVGQSNGQPVVRWYVPIIPMVLVNGSEGTSTVWSSSVPNYNPIDIIANLKRLLKGERTMVAMHPWYKGFYGSIEKNTTEDSYTTSGIIEKVDEETFEITELPIGMWTDDYEEFLKSVSADNDGSLEDPLVEEFHNCSCQEIVHFGLRMSEEERGEEEGLLEKLKLTTCVGTKNMHLFDSEGVIKKYETPEEILEEFFYTRLEIYQEQKEFVLARLEKEMLKCGNKCRYVRCVVDGSIILGDRKRADLVDELKTKGFDPFTEKENISVENSSDYAYLLSLEIGTFALAKMEAERVKLEKEVEDLKRANVKSLWMRDLDALERAFIEENREHKEKWETLRRKRYDDYVAFIRKKNLKAASVEELMEVEAKAAAKPRLAGTKRRGPASKESPDNKVRKLSNEEEESDDSYEEEEEEEESDDSDDEEEESDGSDE